MFKSKLRLTSALSAIATCAIAFPAYAQDTSEDEILITASPLAEATDESLVGVSVISGEELSQRLAGNIGETLKAEPGVSSTFFGAGASRPIIRGQGGDRIRILDNGIGSIDAAAASPDHAVAVEPAMASRIEVLRGSGILRYGSSAAAGVVNVIDGRIPMTAPEGGFDGSVRIGASSVDEGKEAAAGFDFLLGQAGNTDVIFHLDGTWRETEDYDIPGLAESARQIASEEDDDDEDHDEDEEIRDTLTNSFTESDSIAAGLSFVGDRGFFGIAIKQFNSEYGLPGGAHGHHHHDEHEEGEEHDEDEDHEEEEEEGDIKIVLDQLRYDINAGYEFAGSAFEKITFTAGYADYEHQEIEGNGEVGTTFSNEGYELRTELIQREQNGWQAAYGVQLRDREFSAIGEEAFVPPTESKQVGIFTFHEFKTGNWHLEGAARFENTEHEATVSNISRDFDTFSFSLGADYHVDEFWRIGGHVTKSQRAPTSEELFSNGPHLATNQFEVGDNTLEEEEATSIELSLRHQYENHRLTVNVFHTDYDDYIFLGANGEEEDELPVYVFQAVDATFKGFEIESDWDLGTHNGVSYSLDGTIEYVEAERSGTGNQNLPLIPPLGVLVGLEAQGDRFDLRAEVDYFAEQDDNADFELPTDSATQLNLFATYRPLQDDDSLAIRFAALNLTDEEVRQHASPLKEFVPLPGRNFKISLEKSF